MYVIILLDFCMILAKYLILIPLFWLLALVEHSFLPHFTIFQASPNLVFISVFFLNFCEKEKSKFGLFAAFLGGLFLDIYSSFYFGFFTFLLLLIALLIKKAKIIIHSSWLISFPLIFTAAFLVFKFFSLVANPYLNLFTTLTQFFYNFIIASLIFLIFQYEAKAY